MTETTTESVENQDEKRFKWTRERKVLAVIFVLIVLISIALLVIVLWPRTKDWIYIFVRDYILIPIEGLHIALQVLIFLGLMIVQSLFPPIPSEFVLVAGGILFGWAWGTVVGVVGSMFSAAITFYIAQRGGRSLIDSAGKRDGLIERSVLIFDLWIKRWGLFAIIIGRAVPVIMFDPISYAAGLAKVKSWQYYLATFIGSIPRAVFYGWLAKNLGITTVGSIDPDDINQFNKWFLILFGVLVFMFILSNVIYYIRKRRLDKKQEDIDDDVVKIVKKKEPVVTTAEPVAESIDVEPEPEPDTSYQDQFEPEVTEEMQIEELPEPAEEIIEEPIIEPTEESIEDAVPPVPVVPFEPEEVKEVDEIEQIEDTEAEIEIVDEPTTDEIAEEETAVEEELIEKSEEEEPTTDVDSEEQEDDESIHYQYKDVYEGDRY
jgi:uncharacterized membrane protein YdjX (TVP38/TMEM64 family)